MEITEKLLDSKSYIRINNSNPELIRVEPMITADSTFVPDLVRVFIDDQTEPTVYSRESLAFLLQQWECVPLENVLNFKHKLRH